MKQEEILEYLNKKVKIVTKGKMYFSGKVLQITESIMVVDDFRAGKVKIDFFEISSIQEMRNGR